MVRSISLVFWIACLLGNAAAGALYALMLDRPLREGIIYGILIGTLVILCERGFFVVRLRQRLKRLPTLAYFVVAEGILVAFVVVGMWLGNVSSRLLGFDDAPFGSVLSLSGPAMLYSLAVSAAFVFAMRMRDLVGREVFVNFVLGRYHRPVQEERIFLFLDLVGSTAYAQRRGDLAAQEYLGAVFAAIAEPVRRFRGQVDDYVGDLAIVTWPLQRGAADGRCIGCVFAILDALSLDPAGWRKRFGEVPRLRAALHGGGVVTAEVGVDRHKIAYFGDTVNATARLEALCRETGEAVLISQDLLERIGSAPSHVSCRAIGRHALRGRSDTMDVVALDRRAAVAGIRAAPIRMGSRRRPPADEGRDADFAPAIEARLQPR